MQATTVAPQLRPRQGLGDAASPLGRTCALTTGWSFGLRRISSRQPPWNPS